MPLLAEVDETLGIARAGGTAVIRSRWPARRARRRMARHLEAVLSRHPRRRRFVVRPSWDPGEAPPGEHVIDLDPGRAFGTGAHPSTRLVIGFIEAARRAAPANYLDLGCGSGILSIVAASCGRRRKGLAVDVDAESIECAGENFDRNGVSSVERRAGGLERRPGASIW